MHYKVKLGNISNSCDIVKINNDGIAYALSQIINNSDKKLFIHITQNDARAKEFENQIKFLEPSLNIVNFPAWDCIPYDRSSPKPAIISARIEALSYLSQNINISNQPRVDFNSQPITAAPPSGDPLRAKQNIKQQGLFCSNKTLVIATINAVLQKTIPQEIIKGSGFLLKSGDEINIENLSNILIKNGYQRSPNAESIGEFAIRGSIVDIIIQNKESGEESGYRLDFFGDQLESIRIFDPLTQISSGKVDRVSFLPNKEITLNEQSIANFKNNYRNLFGINKNDLIYENVIEGRNVAGIEHFLPLFYNNQLGNFFDYLKDHSYQISFENSSESQKQQRLKEIKQYYQARLDTLKESEIEGSIYNPLPPEMLYLNERELEMFLTQNLLIRFDNFENHYFGRIIDVDFKPVPDFVLASKSHHRSAFNLLKDFIGSELTGRRIIIACNSSGSAERLEKILLNHEIAAKLIENRDEIQKLAKNFIGLAVFPSETGFYCQDLAIIAESSLLGNKPRISKKSRKLSQNLIGESLGISIDELVVHRYHGIGRFCGLQTISANNITNDFLKIAYFGGDNLFVPVENIDLISRYGADNALIQLDRLGSSAWKNRSGKIKNRIKIAAEELIKIAAMRHAKKAPILTPPLGEYEEFKAKFQFVETPDQLSAIAEIEEDLAKGQPMDRLVCGDVGFGKTEVAMRAAFIAAKNENKPFQVAIITPTTLLSRQHFNNFFSRFEGTGLKIAQLSRMITPAKAREVKQELEEGKINIVIGTHALLAKNIKFKNLGLVIVDEEQHFGVGQKERLKELRNEVHILTLSATPIPRTLQMSLTGVKDLSLIATPPIDRIAIRSFVMDYDSVIIKEAILREFHRGGKIFFVVPKIKDLEEIAPRLEKLVPEVKIRSAHGQMSPGALDEIMNEFFDGKFQLLLSTTIIESGIDIKDANTIIIHKAQMFGLSQLYQLRGRVGRGKIRAYAYLTTPAKMKLSEGATKKLQVMQTLDALGAGFTIASHDMDIRGSGNILGDEQSGHIKETGVELYQDMLNEAIANLKVGNIETVEDAPEYQIQIKLKISLIIPESYISDLSLRLSFYKRIAEIQNLEDKEQLAIELIDRFGKLPVETNNLLDAAHLKSLCQKCNIEKLEAKKEGILIGFKNNHFDHPDKLLQMVFSSQNKIKLQAHQILFTAHMNSDEDKIKSAFSAVNKVLALY